MQSFGSNKQRSCRAWLLLLGLVRALAVVFALHLGGVVHNASDLVSAMLAEPGGEHEQCPADGPCDDCPPGCPNCHCGVLGSLAPTSRLALLPGLALPVQVCSLEVAEVPAGPELPSLFRPPRA